MAKYASIATKVHAIKTFKTVHVHAMVLVKVCV